METQRIRPVRTAVAARKSEFAGAVNNHEQVIPVLFGMHFREIDMQITDGIILGFIFGGFCPSSFISGRQLMP